MTTRAQVRLTYLFILLFTLTGILPAGAQHFRWQADLPAVSQSGFYNIPLDPSFIAKCRDSSLADIRLFLKDTAVAYILKKDSLYVALPSPDITPAENAAPKKTLLRLTFQENYLIHRLQFDITAPAYYRRKAYIIARKDEVRYERSNCFTIATGQTLITLKAPIKGRLLFLEIEDEDNPPLKVAKIVPYQHNYLITAWLEKEGKYVLKTGNTTIPTPVYDLPYFSGNLPTHIPELTAGNITPADTVPQVISCFPAGEKPTLFKSKVWIWVAIIGIALLISLLSYRLLKDMRERRQ